MNKSLRWKVLAIVAVVALGAWAIYPPAQKIRLGLDLKGGVHLVLRVQTDDALRLETETAMTRLREELVKAGAAGVTATALGPTSFQIAGVPAEQDGVLRQAATEVEATFNRESGASGTYVFRVKANIANQIRQETVDQAIRTIERRVNELGVAEPIVARQGGQDQILVQLPGVDDVTRAKEIIKSTSLLELTLVEAGPASTREQLLTASGGMVPSDAEVLPGVASRGRRADSCRCRVLPAQEDARRERTGPSERAPVHRREQPSGGAVLSEVRRRHAVRPVHRQQPRPEPGDRA